MIRRIFFLALLSFSPLCSYGAVTINEVAWMGTDVSANHEWIEIYNSGEARDMSGWSISDGEGLEITLTGILDAGAYAMLERTSDESAPGAAFLIYTGALKNSGSTLTLYRPEGSIEDRVSGGSDWNNIGGDNTTKETAQYTNAGWITAEATPGFQNKTEEVITLSELDTNNTSVHSVVKNDGHLAKPLTLPGVTLHLDIEAPSQWYVGLPVDFSVIPSGIGNTIKNSLIYNWNFGDTHTVSTDAPVHTFMYPGSYVVHVTGEYARQYAEALHEITILPIALSLTKNATGDIQIHNDSPYTVDIGGYKLSGTSEVRIPTHTKILANQTVTIDKERVLDFDMQMIGLYDREHVLVASILPHIEHTREEQAVIERGTSFQYSRFEDTDTDIYREQETGSEEVLATETGYTQPTSFSDEHSSKTQQESAVKWPVLLLAMLLLIASLFVLLKPKSTTDSLSDVYER